MSSESKSEVNSNLDEDSSNQQMMFVKLMQEHKVVLQKSQVSAVKAAKKAALKKSKQGGKMKLEGLFQKTNQ